MTAQVPDLLLHEATEYCLLDTTAGAPFDPAAHGFSPVSTSTACHRGHVCAYAIRGGRLQLHALAISHGAPTRGLPELWPLPLFHGVAATPEFELRDGVAGRLTLVGRGDCQGRYDGLGLDLAYDGTLLIGTDPYDDGPRWAGHVQPWEMRRVLMVTFAAGRVQQITDVSALYATVRERYAVEEQLFGDGRRNARRFLRRHLGTSFSM